MEMKIKWSALSEEQLKSIFDYYSLKAGISVARQIIEAIIQRVDILETHPQSGPLEELLQDYPENFRYLVEGNYKIIYWIKDHVITIASVFDCRQNPEKIRKL